ncbi:hypothetical protein DB88DRAFT_215688 [Papiliotrema laurentii]|uniref:Uncharacterized protein n=1 Tax=Papiliotrema laurentii TaxID=5418 RepID=A0AAD9FTJ4_PAPLA|nr:hypothetical protein DB88DRAFT_215688 [Papiliotrema laurentii]
MAPLPHLLTATSSSSPLTRIQSTPSPCSSSDSSSSFSSGFESSNYDPLSGRRKSDTSGNDERRESTGSMTSWSTAGDGIFKPPDDAKGPPSVSPYPSPSPTPGIATAPTHSPHEVTTPDSDNDANYFDPRNGNISPASSATSTAASKGGATPRAEISAPVWPMGPTSPTLASNGLTGEYGDMDVDMVAQDDKHHHMKTDATMRRRHAR